MLTFSLTEQMPSGKNRIKETFVRGKKIRYPDARFKAWRATASVEIMQQKRTWSQQQKMALPLRNDIYVTISYRALDKRRRDIPGMLDALWHLLEYAEIIEDDAQIKGVTWDYPWRTEGPCMEMELCQA